MGEFDLIARFFKRAQRDTHAGTGVVLGIGDDCALLRVPAGQQLAVSCDMLVQGRHFLPTVDPVRLGHKALAVNLSDLAACGAQPVAFTLALALPNADPAWLQAFSQGLFALADAHGCELMGGDTTQGPLNICITVFGHVPVAGSSTALLRSGAQVGDDIYVSGHLGDARLALEVFRGTVSVPEAVFATARERMECPTPRVALGQALRGVATSAIDISDGLLGDLSHVLTRSGVGACIELAAIPALMACEQAWRTSGSRGWSEARVLEYVLAGGDDYELAFTAPPHARAAVYQAAQTTHTPVHRIGCVQADPGVRLRSTQGDEVQNIYASFDHFK